MIISCAVVTKNNYALISIELPLLIQQNFPVNGKFGITGHSMGGHGAIVCGLRNPQLFSSISAFAPICNPINGPWGRDKTFKFYLGDENQAEWKKYDSCELAKTYNGPERNILVDQVGKVRLVQSTSSRFQWNE